MRCSNCPVIAVLSFSDFVFIPDPWRASAGVAPAPRRPAARTSVRVEAALHDGDVVPAAELEGRFPLEADGPKVMARVQVKRCGVLRGDTRQDRMVPARPGPLDQLTEDQRAEPGSAP